jgi:Short C-terminal domain
MADMGDMAVPGAGPGGDEIADAAAAAPAMPLIQPSEQYVGSPYPLVDGARLTLGWLWRGDRAFALVTRGMSGGYKAREMFPLTEDGWAAAWDVLARLSPDAAGQARQVLRERAAQDRARLERDGLTPELIALDVESLAVVRGVTLLGGYAPEVDMLVGHQYDIRFREERLAVYRHPRPDLVIEFPYAEIEAVDIGGPGLVSSPVTWGSRPFGAIVALEGLATAAVLSSLTVRAAIKTIIRVQAADAELFLLCTWQPPEDLRIYLSRPLGEIRAAHAAAAAPDGGTARVEHLTRLASMLDSGLLTRAEFDALKADLLRGP